jgi:hypothetical protein
MIFKALENYLCNKPKAFIFSVKNLNTNMEVNYFLCDRGFHKESKKNISQFLELG